MIERLFKVTVEFSYPDVYGEKYEDGCDYYAFDDELLKIIGMDGHIVSMSPASYPRVEAEYTSLREAKIIQDKLISFINYHDGEIDP